MPIKVRRIDFSPDEWIGGTVGLTLAEEGLYIRICALIYSHGGPITCDLLKRACHNDHGNRINACLDKLVALGKVTRNGSEIDQKRCRFELEKASIRVGKRSEIDSIHLGKASENEAESNHPNGLESPRPSARTRARPRAFNHQLPTINCSEASASVAGATAERSPDDATRFSVESPPDDAARQCGTLWDRGIAVLGEDPAARSLIGKMRKEHGDIAVIDAIIACESAAPSDPIAYLRACLGRSQTNARRRSPNEKLFAGFAQAAGDCGPDWPLADPFLVAGRRGTDP